MTEGLLSKAKRENQLRDQQPPTSKTIEYQYPDGRKGWCGEPCYVPNEAKIIRTYEDRLSITNQLTAQKDSSLEANSSRYIKMQPRDQQQLAKAILDYHRDTMLSRRNFIDLRRKDER